MSGHEKNSRGVKAGRAMADTLIEFIHMMYNKSTSIRVLGALIDRLEERVEEFK